MKECINCKKEFEPNSGKQKFCSGKCKMAFSRNKKLVNTVIKPEFIPKCKEVETISTVTSWIKEIEDYCGEQGILPSDLIEAHKSLMSLKIKKDDNIPKSKGNENLSQKNQNNDIPFVNSFRNSLRNKKCGL